MNAKRDLLWNTVGLNRKASTTVGVLGLVAVMAICAAGIPADRPAIDHITAWWDRQPFSHIFGRTVRVPPCPDPGGSWWFQGTLLCTTAPARRDVVLRCERERSAQDRAQHAHGTD